MSTNIVVVSGPLATFVSKVIEAGHGVALESIDSTRGAKTRVVILVRHPKEAGNVGALGLMYTFYADSPAEFLGISDEFEDMCFYSQASGIPFLAVAERLKDAMRQAGIDSPTYWTRVAQVESGRGKTLCLPKQA